VSAAICASTPARAAHFARVRATVSRPDAAPQRQPLHLLPLHLQRQPLHLQRQPLHLLPQPLHPPRQPLHLLPLQKTKAIPPTLKLAESESELEKTAKVAQWRWTWIRG